MEVWRVIISFLKTREVYKQNVLNGLFCVTVCYTRENSSSKLNKLTEYLFCCKTNSVARWTRITCSFIFSFCSKRNICFCLFSKFRAEKLLLFIQNTWFIGPPIHTDKLPVSILRESSWYSSDFKSRNHREGGGGRRRAGRVGDSHLKVTGNSSSVILTKCPHRESPPGRLPAVLSLPLIRRARTKTI